MNQVELWPLVSLGDHVDLLTGFPFQSAEYSNDLESVRLLRGDNVGQGYLRWDGVKRWPPSKVAGLDKYWLQKGDVILAMDRPWIEAGLKYAWITEQDLPSLLVQRVARIRGANGLITEYLRYVIAAPSFTDYIEPIVTGVAVPHISGPQIQAYRFRLPPLETQRKIAAILSAYDDLIEVNTRRIALLEEMARGLYREWFVRFRYPGHEGARMVESAVGVVPEGWEVRPVSQVLSYVINGGWGEEDPTDEYSVRASVIRGTDIPEARRCSVDKCPVRFHKPSNFRGRRLQPGDIIMEVSGGSKGQPVGRTLLVSDRLLEALDGEAMCASFCKLLRVDRSILLPELLYLQIREIYDDGRIEKYQVQSTGIINLKSAYFLENELVLIPDPQTQREFGSAMVPMLELTQTLGTQNANLSRARDLLLPRLVAGEVAVHE